MPAVTRRPSETTQSQTESGTSQTPETAVQDPLQEQLKDGGSAAGLANYQSSLGKWLGTELYEALAKELTLGALQEHATKAWKSALEAGVEGIDGIDGNDGESAAFTAALQEAYGQAAAEMLDTDTGKKVIGKLNGFVDANPRLILMVALMAAGGAIAANVPLPKLKETFKLGAGFSAKVGADLGKIRDIALKDLSAALEYNSGPLMAAVSINRNEDGEVSGNFKSTLGDDAKNLKADARITENGLEVATVKGLFTTEGGTKFEGGVTGGEGKSTVATGSITTVEGDVTNVNSIKYDSDSGLLSFQNVKSTQLGKSGTLSTDVGGSSDGSSYGGISASGQVAPNTKGTAGFKQTLGTDGSVTNSLNGSLDYRHNDLNAGVSGNYVEGKGGSLSANASGNLSDNVTAGGKITHNFGDSSSTSGNAFLKYDTPDLKLGGDYSFDTKNDQHKASIYGQKKFGDDYSARLDASMLSNNSGTGFEAGGLVHRKINDDFGVFGGGSYKQDADGGRFVPKAGVEVKGVPLQYSYDPATKQHKVGVTLFKW